MKGLRKREGYNRCKIVHCMYGGRECVWVKYLPPPLLATRTISPGVGRKVEIILLQNWSHGNQIKGWGYRGFNNDGGLGIGIPPGGGGLSHNAND